MRLIDSVTVPTGQELDGPGVDGTGLDGTGVDGTGLDGAGFDNTVIGGLSGIDYDPATGSYAVISDDKGEHGPVRVYTLDLPIADGALGTPRFTGMVPLDAPDGEPYGYGAADTESVRITPEGGYLYGSEGYGLPGQSGSRAPFLRESSRDGSFLRDYPLPAAFEPRGDADGGRDGQQIRGLRPNQGFEGLALSADGALISAIAEDALVQDGPAITADSGSVSRLLQIDRATGEPGAQYVYRTDPMATAGIAIGPTAAGVSAMTQAGPGRYLVVERSFAVPKMFTVRIYLATTDGATDVSGRASLDGTETPMRKTEVFDFADAGVDNNIEGITAGPRMADGRRTLVAVADDNFGQIGSTTFYLLAVDPGGGR